MRFGQIEASGRLPGYESQKRGAWSKKLMTQSKLVNKEPEISDNRLKRLKQKLPRQLKQILIEKRQGMGKRCGLPLSLE